MEFMGALPEGGEWSSFDGVFTTEEADFMAQLLSNYSFSSEEDYPSHEPTTKMAGAEESLNSCLDTFNSNSYYFPQGISCSSSTTNHENYNLSDPNPVLLNNSSSMFMDACMVDESIQIFPDIVMSGNSFVESGETLQPKRKSEIDQPDNMSLENPKKRSRVSGCIQKEKKNVHSKKNQKFVPISKDEGETNPDLIGHCSSSYSSEDDTNVSQELIGGATSTPNGSNETTRTTRGLATDAQSLYARKRREKINERLKILQNLVPNGTKVDISTMLEEAVQYVKFLQVQIKLLSSDDLWMYAPIAYNGMNIGLNLPR